MELVNQLSDQWALVLAARLLDCPGCDSSKIRAACKSNKVLVGVLERGTALHSKYDQDLIKKMFKSVVAIINQFANSAEFSRLCVSMLITTRDILLLPLGGDTAVKAKAIHTKQLVAEQKLSEMEVLRCEVFEFLSSFLQKAHDEGAKFGAVDKDSISAVFRFVEHDQPNKVRACAGKILAVMSFSPPHCEEICNTFWAKFAKLKKDADFRNFSAWIDAVVGLHVSFDDPGLAKAGISFLSKFNAHSKRIERGVLRRKFLEALASMIAKLGASRAAAANEEFNQELAKIWALVLKWAKRDKHTEFCYSFLVNVLGHVSKAFFVKNGTPLMPELVKYGREGAIAALKMIADFVRASPPDLQDLDPMLKTHVIAFLFPAKEDGKIKIRFPEENRRQGVIQILAEVGLKKVSVFKEFASRIFAMAEPDPVVRQIRLMLINATYKMCQATQDWCSANNEDFMVWLNPILKRDSSSTASEFDAAVFTFPALRPKSGKEQAEIAKSLFEASFDNSSAFNSLCVFVEKYSHLDGNLILPIELITKLLDNLAKQTSDNILQYLSLVTGLLGSYAACLQNCGDQVRGIPEGKAAVTTGHWTEFRSKIDSESLVLLIHPMQEIRQMTYDFLLMLREDVFKEIDRMCLPDTYFSLSAWCEHIPRDKEVFGYIHEICDTSLVSVTRYFDNLMHFWNRNKTLSEEYQLNIILFLATIVREDHAHVKDYFMKLFDSARTIENCIPKALAVLSKDLWVRVFIVLDEWMTAHSLDYCRHWPGIVNIHYAFAVRKEFEEMASVEFFLGCYKKFCRRVWQDYGKLICSFAVNEKALKTVSIVVEKSSFKTIVPPEEMPVFVMALCGMGSLSSREEFTPSYMDTLLSTMVAVFGHLTFQEKDSFAVLKHFVLSITEAYQNDVRIQLLVTQLFSTILTVNPMFIFDIFQLAMDANPVFCVIGVLSLGNALCGRSDFATEYENGMSVIMAATLTNIYSENPVIRQAAFKLMCLMTSSSAEIYNQEVPSNLMMPLTSPSASGFTLQADNFVAFASKYVKKEITLNMFTVMSDSLSKKDTQAPLVGALIKFVPVMIEATEMEQTISIMIKLTGQCRCDDGPTALAVKNLCYEYLSTFKERFGGQEKELIQSVFEYGVSQESMTSNEARSAVIFMSYIFHFYPESTAEFLLPIALKPYNHALPDDMENFCGFLNEAAVTLEPSKPEIIASSALSQIFLIIGTKEQFISLFGGKLEVLLLAAIMEKSCDWANMGQFHPLLDSLIDATLFRFAESNDKFSTNLQKLQEKNFIKRATTLTEQYEIGREEGARMIVAYDNKLVKTLVKLFTQADPKFSDKFFGKLLPFAFQLTPGNPRTLEPFMMIMAVGKEMSTASLFYLLLFTIYVFRTNRIDLMDCLVDCIRSHILSIPIDSISLETEAAPVIIVLMMYLTLNLKTSFAVHIMNIIFDVVSRVIESSFKEKVAAAILEHLSSFEGDKHIARQFVKFLREVRSFGDDSVKTMIVTLDLLSTLYNEESNWCSLLAILCDGSRYFIGKCGPVETPRILEKYKFETVEEFSEILRTRFTTPEYSSFIISFFCNLVTFKNEDLGKESAVLAMLTGFCSDTSVISSEMSDSLYRFVSLICSICEDPWRKNATGLLARMLTQSKSPISKKARCLTSHLPKFVSASQKGYGNSPMITKTVIAAQCLPSFELLPETNNDDNVLDSQWNFICGKIGRGSISFVLPKANFAPQVTEEPKEGKDEASNDEDGKGVSPRGKEEESGSDGVSPREGDESTNEGVSPRGKEEESGSEGVSPRGKEEESGSEGVSPREGDDDSDDDDSESSSSDE